jgi:DNA-binding transcriptional MerR regulator
MMLIHQICEVCNVTKKAVAYYQKQGLIKSKNNDNGYRVFDNEDVSLLKEISLLRKLNISIPDIKTIMNTKDRHKALSDCIIKKELQIERMKAQYDCLNLLLDSDYNIEKALETMTHRLDENMMIKDKLIQVFPGNFGMYINIHFGRFLNEKVISHDQILAYYKIIEVLDNMNFPEELEQSLTKIFSALSDNEVQLMDESVNMNINNYSNFITDNEDKITEYLEYRNSNEFKSSSIYRLQHLLIDFQKSNGYYDVFIPNLKILSYSYREYQEKLQLANEEFLMKYPKAKNIYKE